MKKFVTILMILSFSIIIINCKKEKKVKEDEIKSRVGIINFVTGSVSIITSGGTSPAKVGGKVKDGMKIITGAKSFVDIYFNENAVKITENSEVEIKKLSLNKTNNSEDTELFLAKGKIFSKVVKKLSKNDSYKVSTPTATAGIRGTDFVVSEDNGKGNIAVLDGKVAVKKSGKPDSTYVELNAGQEVDVQEGVELSVRSLKEENLNNIKKIIDDIRDMREEIKRQFEDERRAILEKVDEQRTKDKEMVEQQKEQDRKNIEEIKGDIKDSTKNIKESFQKDKESTKVNLKDTKPKLDDDKLKPTIKKPDLKIN